MKRIFTLVVTSLAVILTATGSASAATAGSGNGFQISPVRSEISIDKGQSQTVDITVTNPTNQATAVQAVVNDFVASSDESGDPRLLLNGQVSDPRHDFKSLVQRIPNFTIPADGSKDVSVTIAIPRDAASGGYYGAVRFVPTSSNGGGNVGLTASVGTLFLITVPGNLVQKLNLVQLSAADNGQASNFLTAGNPQILTRLQNVGDIHVQPFGKVTIKDMFGKTVASYEFNNTNPRANILPNSIRKFVDSLPKRSWFGRYTITASLAYSNGSGNLIDGTASFWYLPFWALIVLAAVIVAIVALVYWLIMRRRRRHSLRRR